MIAYPFGRGGATGPIVTHQGREARKDMA